MLINPKKKKKGFSERKKNPKKNKTKNGTFEGGKGIRPALQ